MHFLGSETKLHACLFDCLIVGSGAAAYNAAVHLYEKGVREFAILTENRLSGTSRNTGSDKQTYYKIACSGNEKDSPMAMAETLFAGGSMDGDLALCEASHSLEEFFHLVSIGVDFPHNVYGEYAGYKTDNDPLQRASSIGPYTSKKMTEQLEQAAEMRGIRVIDKSRVVKILTDRNGGRSFGVLCMEGGKDFKVYFTKNLIFATGGPPGLYKTTVYPESQFGSSGIVAREGVVFANITEWQYGIGSVKFRWNLSGSYQQVIPRYISIDDNGKEEEFLQEYFSSVKNLSRAVFLKGYQWPFDPEKIIGEGSSLIDLAIYIERHIKGKQVFLDYTRNPSGLTRDDGQSFSFNEIDQTARSYLKNSGALGPAPLERLISLNAPAYELYKTHGIDLAKEYLEIDVLPQHHNGGAEVSIWWETSVKHLFAIGECAGTHGVHRPGGSALNSGQVGGLRAASYIAGYYLKEDSFYDMDALEKMAEANLAEFENEIGTGSQVRRTVPELLERLQEMNSRGAAFIRCREELLKYREELAAIAGEKVEVQDNLEGFFRYKEMLLLSRLLYDGILFFIDSGGKSRGSYLIAGSKNDLKALTKGVKAGDLTNERSRDRACTVIAERMRTRRFIPRSSAAESLAACKTSSQMGAGLALRYDTLHSFRDFIINTVYARENDTVTSYLRKVRPIPVCDTWFEKVWREYREGEIFKPLTNRHGA